MTIEHAILEILRAESLPVTAAQLAKQTRGLVGTQAASGAVASALASLVASGAVNRIQAGTAAKPQPLYTTQTHEQAAAAMLRQRVHSAKKEQEAAKLRSSLPAILHTCFEGALAQLVADGGVFVLPGAKRLVYAHRPKPSSLLSAAQRKALQKIFYGVNPARAREATLADFITWLDEATVVPSPTLPALPSPGLVLAPDERLLRQWYDQDRLRSSTVMIPIPQTFARYQAWAVEQGGTADSQVLRNFMEGLYNNGHLLLEPCERPQDLPAHERAMLVPMSLGPPGWSWCWVV